MNKIYINKKRIACQLCSIFTLFLMIGCTKTEPTVDNRWYTEAQVTAGQTIFANNCAQCHGKNAQGTFNWKRPLADGSYPPPPLNGTAHTWHHPMSMLVRTIKKGGTPVGGKMPPFENTLSNEEIASVIAFLQSKWNDKTYGIWQNRNKANK